MNPFKFLKTYDTHEFHFELHGHALSLTYYMDADDFDIHEENSVIAMIQDTQDTWRFYRGNIDRRVMDIIEETLDTHLKGQSKVRFVFE